MANRLIEDAGIRQRKSAAQIFIEEWSTTGRIRPTLSHLLQLLVRSELFRAADYVAINLLSGKLEDFKFYPNEFRFSLFHI